MNNRKHHPKREELLGALRRQESGSDHNADYQPDEFTRKALSGLRRHSDVEKALKRLDERVQYQGDKLYRPPFLWVSLAVAAACALALWVWPAATHGLVDERALVSQAPIQADEAALAAALGKPLPSLTLGRTRSAESVVAADDVLADAVARYAQGDFEGAIPHFAAYAAMAPEEKGAWLFWGHALLQDRPREAAPILASLVADAEMDPTIGAQARYLLGWAHVKMGDIAEGRRHFEALAGSGGYLSAEAGVLLSALSSGKSFAE